MQTLSPQVYDLIFNLFTVLVFCSCAQAVADYGWWN